jgi:hypothetical protein
MTATPIPRTLADVDLAVAIAKPPANREGDRNGESAPSGRQAYAPASSLDAGRRARRLSLIVIETRLARRGGG